MERRITLGGQDISLRYTVNAMCAVEERAQDALDKLADRQFTATRLLLWGGMLEKQPGTTPDMAGEIITRHIEMGGTLEQVVDKCALALEDAGFFRHSEPVL